MKKYRVSWDAHYSVGVEAEDENEAWEKATKGDMDYVEIHDEMIEELESNKIYVKKNTRNEMGDINGK